MIRWNIHDEIQTALQKLHHCVPGLYIDGLVQKRHNSIAKALELHVSLALTYWHTLRLSAEGLKAAPYGSWLTDSSMLSALYYSLQSLTYDHCTCRKWGLNNFLVTLEEVLANMELPSSHLGTFWRLCLILVSGNVFFFMCEIYSPYFLIQLMWFTSDSSLCWYVVILWQHCSSTASAAVWCNWISHIITWLCGFWREITSVLP